MLQIHTPKNSIFLFLSKLFFLAEVDLWHQGIQVWEAVITDQHDPHPYRSAC